ncbi:MAG: F0F1 ATP synthase subunit gamma [Thermodesulfobacteriota bacterium]
METLQALDKRISSIARLQGIVKSMKILAAVNIRQYEKALASSTTSVEIIELGLLALLREGIVLPRYQEGATKRGVIVFGSDQGLCGRFNERLAEYVGERLPPAPTASPAGLLVIGSRIAARLAAAGYAITESFWLPGSVAGINTMVYQILLSLEQWRQHDGIDSVEIFYNRHEKDNPARPAHLPLLPLNNERLQELGKRRWPGRSLPCLRVPTEQLFSALIRQYLFITLYRVQTESLASEQASRLLSLQNAEKNIEEHMEELRSEYRVQRQSTITAELLDLVAGYTTTVKKTD